jgi:hypothetical protein
MFEEQELKAEADRRIVPTSSIYTAEHWLVLLLGPSDGKEVYGKLYAAAKAHVDYEGLDGLPGIVFNDDGGRFVSLDAQTAGDGSEQTKVDD